MNNLKPKENSLGGGGGAQYAKLDPRLICLICIYSISKAQPAKYRKRINKVN